MPIIPPDQPVPKSSTISKMQKFKTSICKNYLANDCSMGKACHFAHGDEDLWKVTDVSLLDFSHYLSTFMSFTNRRKQPVLLSLTIRQWCARTMQSSVSASLETDALLLMEISMATANLKLSCLRYPQRPFILLMLNSKLLTLTTRPLLTGHIPKCLLTLLRHFQPSSPLRIRSGDKRQPGTILSNFMRWMEDLPNNQLYLLLPSKITLTTN